MTAITDTPTLSAAPLARAVAAFAAVVVRRAKQVLRAARHRRDAATLAGFDDRMLADIGLTRGDLRDAMSIPLWQDPTPILVSRAGERRAARHRGGLAATAAIVTAPSIVPHADAAAIAPHAPA
jgi:uncharacterized protein YjiS (DUF1127 family)